MYSLPSYSMREMMEAGVHFGHKTKRWNPKMAPFLFGIRNDVHIIDLQQTVPMLDRALKSVHDIVLRNGRVLFVGTKRQAQDTVAEYAKRCGQYYVNHRWLGGMLTNWKTISESIRKLRDLEELLNSGEAAGLTKKERLNLTRQKERLDRALGGIRDMGGVPDILVVVDTNKEDIAVMEARKLGIPVIGILDSNSDPDGIVYPVPGNDDSSRAIRFYCRVVSEAVLSGIERGIGQSPVDTGANDVAPVEKSVAKKPTKAKAEDSAQKSDEKTAEDTAEPVSEEALKELADAKNSDAKETKADKAEEKPKAAKKASTAKKADEGKSTAKKASAKKEVKKNDSDAEDKKSLKKAS